MAEDHQVRAHGFQGSDDVGVFRRHATSPGAKTSHSALFAYALRKRRRVAAAERAWRAFAARNPATVVHSPRSTDFASLCATASNTTSCASRLRCFRLGTVVDPGRFARGISSVSIAHAQHGGGFSSISRLPARIAGVACRKLMDTPGASRRDSEDTPSDGSHEIKQIARLESVLAAEGAIALLERISPALEHVDSSSGAIGSAVNRVIAELVPVVSGAPADARTRAAWLDRLFEAHAADQIPYIEQLAEYWGELCGSSALASEWADRLITITRLALSSDKSTRGYFHGTSACLSALFTAGRYEELIELVKNDVLWSYKRWAVRAMTAQGRRAEAVAYAERCRSPWASDTDTLTAAANAGVDGAVRTRIRALFDDPATRSGFVASVMGKELGLD